jgi:putative transposase
MTPAAFHHGHAEQLHAARVDVLDAAYQRHPERFVRKPPAPPYRSRPPFAGGTGTERNT